MRPELLGAALTAKQQKPTEWRVDRALLPSRVQSLFERASLVAPLFGDTLENVKNAEKGVPTNVTKTHTSLGRAYNCDDAWSHINWAEDLGVSTGLTYIFTFRVAGTKLISGGGGLLGQTKLSSGDEGGARSIIGDVDWSLLYTGSILRARWAIGGASNTCDLTQSLSNGDRVTVAVRRDDTAAKIWAAVDGAVATDTATVDSGNIDRDWTSGFHVGSGYDDAPNRTLHDTGMDFEVVAVWPEALTDSNIEMLVLDPFALIRPDAAKVLSMWAPAAAGGGAPAPTAALSGPLGGPLAGVF